MTPELLDKRGTKIEVGSRVAYNLSGGVALGTVKAITPEQVRHYSITYTHCYILITPDSDWDKVASKTGVSKMKVHLTYGNLVDKVVVLDRKEST
jgi:hypothetical protein